MSIKSEHTIIQCSKSPLPDYIVEQLMENFPGWEYRHFDDDSMYQFMVDNPLEELPSAERILKTFYFGAHKADYFRYFYLYSRGGIFIDSDLMIENSIIQDIENYDFITVINRREEKKFVFQGLLYCMPGNKMIYESLYNLYSRKIHDFDLRVDYHAACRDLYEIILSNKSYKVKMYEEDYVLIKDDEFPVQAAALILDGDRNIGIHYYQKKNIPRKPMKADNGKRILRYI